jgi:alpha-mannosidase
VQVKHTYGRSSITQIFSLRAGGKTLDVRVILDWQEEHKMLKIAYGVAADAPRAYYEIPFGVIERPADGEEEPGYRWFALKDGRRGYAILNSNKYSFSARDNVMYLTAVRSPLFADHGQPSNDRCRFTDQGVQDFSYSFMKLGADGWEDVIKEARMLNSEPAVVLENNHEGYLSSCFEGVSCSRGNVQISAIKRSEDGRGLVVRVYETDGKDTDFELSGGIIRAALSEKIGAYAANTYYLEDGKDSWREVLLTEFDF